MWPFRSEEEKSTNEVFELTQTQAETTRKANAIKRLDYYNGDQLAYIEEQLAVKFKEPDKLQPAFINVTKKIINNLATAYVESPKREVDGCQKDKDIAQDIYEQAAINLKMKQVSRYAKLLKTAIIRVVWRNGQIEIDNLQPSIVSVVTGSTPEDVLGVMITHHADREEDKTYEYITADTIQFLSYRGQQISSEPNPYGVIPIIPIWDELPTDSFFIAGGEDIINAQEAINTALTSLLYTTEMQGFSVGYIKTDSKGGILDYGPGTFLELPVDGEAGFIAPEAPIPDVIQVIETILQQAAINNGLAADSLTSKPTEQSGIARIVANRELMEMRQDDIELFRTYESRLFELIKIVWNNHNPTQKFSDVVNLQIDFADLRNYQSPGDQLLMWDSLLNQGIISQVDVAMERNPDLKTRDEAMAHLRAIAAETQELNRIQVEFDIQQEEKIDFLHYGAQSGEVKI